MASKEENGRAACQEKKLRDEESGPAKGRMLARGLPRRHHAGTAPPAGVWSPRDKKEEIQ